MESEKVSSLSSRFLPIFNGGPDVCWFEWRGKFEALLDLLDRKLFDTLTSDRPEATPPTVEDAGGTGAGGAPGAAAETPREVYDRNNHRIYSRLVLYTEGKSGICSTPVQKHEGWRERLESFDSEV